VRIDTERLRDILETIANIEKYAAQGKEAFTEQELIQVWMVHNLQIVGEAARSISEDFTAQYPEVPWAQIIAFWNIVVHEYFRVDLDLVWLIVVQNLPDLKGQIKAILQGLKD
jgi:uncharacterized protein with HEPN domain